MYMMNDAAARSIDAMKRFEEMGKTLVVMPPEMLQTLQEWTDAWYEEKVKEDPYLARIRESQVEFLKWWAPYSQTKHMDYPAWALGE